MWAAQRDSTRVQRPLAAIPTSHQPLGVLEQLLARDNSSTPGRRARGGGAVRRHHREKRALGSPAAASAAAAVQHRVRSRRSMVSAACNRIWHRGGGCRLVLGARGSGGGEEDEAEELFEKPSWSRPSGSRWRWPWRLQRVRTRPSPRRWSERRYSKRRTEWRRRGRGGRAEGVHAMRERSRQVEAAVAAAEAAARAGLQVTAPRQKRTRQPLSRKRRREMWLCGPSLTTRARFGCRRPHPRRDRRGGQGPRAVDALAPPRLQHQSLLKGTKQHSRLRWPSRS